MAKKRRDAACRCGSGKKFKKCCMVKQTTHLEQGQWAWVMDPQVWQGETDYGAVRCKRWHRHNWSD